MFIATKKGRLKYTMLSRFNGGEWLTGATLSSFDKAKRYGIETSDNGLDCLMVVTRNNQFEYEKRFYAQSVKGCDMVES